MKISLVILTYLKKSIDKYRKMRYNCCIKPQNAVNSEEELLMAFIEIEFGGQKTAGGHLKIDGGKQIKLTDGMIIPIGAGTHYLSFSNQSGATRTMTQASAATGNYDMAYAMASKARDGEITVELDENDIMFFTVVSDGMGNVLGLPTYSVQELTEEGLKQVEEILAEQQARVAARSRRRKKIWGVILAVFGIFCLFGGIATTNLDSALGGLVITAIGVLLFLVGTLKKKKK